MDALLSFLSKKEVWGLILVLFLVYVANKVVDIIVEKIILKSKNDNDKKRRVTIASLIKNIKKYIIIILGLLIVLDLYGVNVSSLIAGLGIASAIAALAMQDVLKDMVSGAAIIMDNYYIVGDYIQYKGFTGKVIQIGLRCTKILDFDGQIYTVANRNINEIVNLSQDTASQLILVPTAYEEKLEKVEKVLNEVVEEIKTWKNMDKNNTAYLGIMDFSDSSIKYGIRFYCKPDDVWKYKRETLRLIKIRYDENNIKIPYNQIEVHNAK